jgi:hypothetical protein
MAATSEELSQLLKQVEDKGIAWETVEEKLKTSRSLLDLYIHSGPVPDTIIKGLNQVLEQEAK